MSDKQMAIIKTVQCGVGDRGRAWLQLHLALSECTGVMQILEWDAAKEFIEAYGVSDVSKLAGKPVWVKPEGDIVELVGPAVL